MANNVNPATLTATSAGELKVYGDKGLDVYNQSTIAGAAVEIWDGNGQANQKWTVHFR